MKKKSNFVLMTMRPWHTNSHLLIWTGIEICRSSFTSYHGERTCVKDSLRHPYKHLRCLFTNQIKKIPDSTSTCQNLKPIHIMGTDGFQIVTISCKIETTKLLKNQSCQVPETQRRDWFGRRCSLVSSISNGEMAQQL